MLSLKVPPLGESIVEATVSRWLKQEGDPVNAGETVVELDTDKITVEVPALRAGVLVKRGVAEGAVVKVGDDLGEIDETATAASRAGAAGGGAGAGGAAAGSNGSATLPAAAPPAPAPAPPSGLDTVKSSPAARRLADEKGVDIKSVPGTGRGGVISKPDVIAVGGGTGAIRRASASRARR